MLNHSIVVQSLQKSNQLEILIVLAYIFEITPFNTDKQYVVLAEQRRRELVHKNT